MWDIGITLRWGSYLVSLGREEEKCTTPWWAIAVSDKHFSGVPGSA